MTSDEGERGSKSLLQAVERLGDNSLAKRDRHEIINCIRNFSMMTDDSKRLQPMIAAIPSFMKIVEAALLSENDTDVPLDEYDDNGLQSLGSKVNVRIV